MGRLNYISLLLPFNLEMIFTGGLASMTYAARLHGPHFRLALTTATPLTLFSSSPLLCHKA